MEIPDNPKWLLLTTGGSYSEGMLIPELERAGLYGWYRAFKGEVKTVAQIPLAPATLNKYDIIQVNLCLRDVGLVDKIKPMLDDTTALVVNLDYGIEYMQEAFNSAKTPFGRFAKDLIVADMAFGVEPWQVKFLEFIFDQVGVDKKPALIPHPVDVEGLSKPRPRGLFVPYEQRREMLAIQYHRYDGHTEIPKILTARLPRTKWGVPVRRCLMGYTGKWQDLTETFEMITPYESWSKYILLLSECLYGLEYRTMSAASRFVLEAASLGVPVVGVDYCYLSTIIFPEITHHPSDFFAIRDSLHRLITDDEFRMELAEKGLERVEQFNLKNSKERYLKELRKRVGDRT